MLDEHVEEVFPLDNFLLVREDLVDDLCDFFLADVVTSVSWFLFILKNC